MFSFYFDVESEIAHFRDPTSHAFLNTFLGPPPHTIGGFLGGCSGFSEKETEEMIEKIRVGCIILRLRGFLKDLVLMENQKNKQRTGFPRARKFLVDPKYRFYIASEDEVLLSKLRESVFCPRHVPYLGISDCLAYIRNISQIFEAKLIKLIDTDSMVGIEEEIEYSTKIKEPNAISVFTEVVRSPTSFEITERGRKPSNQKKFLMSVNCKLFFKKYLEGYEIDGENVCLI